MTYPLSCVCRSRITSQRPLGVSVCKQQTSKAIEPLCVCVCVSQVCVCVLRCICKPIQAQQGEISAHPLIVSGPLQGHCDVSVCIIIAFIVCSS